MDLDSSAEKEREEIEISTEISENIKSQHKLFVCSVLVAMTVFGLTVLTSSSSNSTVPVLAFVNETCNSELNMELESIQEILELDGN